MVIPTNYNFHQAWSSWLKTAFFTTMFALLHATLLNAQTCTAEAGTLSSIEICFQRTQVKLDAHPQGDTVVPSGYRVLYVLTRGDDLVVEAISDDPSFTIDQTDNGLFTIHTLVFDSTTLNLDSILIGRTTGFELNDLFVQGGGSICGSLDTVGARVRFGACESDSCSADAGRLAVANTSDSCFVNGSARLVAQVQTLPIVPAGYSVRYVLTSGTNLVIQQVSDSLAFTVDTTGRYTIHTLVYDSTTLNLDSITIGQTTGAFVDSLFIQGGGSICGALDVTGAVFDIVACDTTSANACAARAGTITVANENYCLGTDSTATLSGLVTATPTIPAGYSVLYVLTSGNDQVIENTSTTPSFTVDTLGRFRILTLVYDSTTLKLDSLINGQLTGPQLGNLLVQGGGSICAALDLNGAFFNVAACSTDTTGVDSCGIRLGTLAIANPNFCLGDSTLSLSANVVDSTVVPAGYSLLYVLTSGDSLLIQSASTTPSFTADTTGRFRIHILVYDSTTFNVDSLVTFGQTTGADIDSLLVQGGGEICGALDVDGLVFDVAACDTTGVDTCGIRLGTFAIANENFCLGDSTATLTVNTVSPAIIPSGYTQLYVLTSGDSLIIEAVDTIPSFTVDTTGRFRIHTIVFDSTDVNVADSNLVRLGQTSALTLLPLFIQGGGTICAALDTTGVIFDVVACDTTGTDSCNVTTGILAPAGTSFCIDSTAGVVTLAGTIVTQPTAPAGYNILYVLSSGDSLVIQQASTTPSFIVDTTGRYTIHTLVYDSTTLNIDSLVTFGQTTGNQLDSLLVQGGGNICGGLDVSGLVFNVRNCSDFNDTCLVSAGALRIVNEDFCFGDSTATLTAAIQTVPNFGPGYQILYVLTSDDSLTVEDVSTTPTFTVDTTGNFRIHILVYDSTTLNLDSLVTFGQTTAAELDSLLIQGGGSICAALDTTGLLFDVIACDSVGTDSCQATAGTVRIANNNFCFQNGTAILTAAVQTAATVPAGYQLLYVLTSTDSLVIRQVSTTPTFTVDTTGRYRIHPFVFDSTTLDLGIVQFDTTTAAAVNAFLIQGGGDICAALDVNGALFDVKACTDTTNVNCDSLSAGGFNRAVKGICVNSNYEAKLVPIRLEEPVLAPGYQVIYLLASGSNSLVIEEISDTASFTVNTTGRLTILTLIYNPNTFDLGSISLGETTANDIKAQLTSSGGNVCGALDMFGARFEVRDCGCGAIPAILGYTGPDENSVCIAPDYTEFMAGNVLRRPIAPNGYQVIYVLTSGNNRVIEAVDNVPIFGARIPGTYRIHSLVYNPATLNLDQIKFGVTTAAEINALLRQGGGTVCAGFDFNGLRFTARACSPEGLIGTTNLYPNPANQYTVIELPQAENVEHITIMLVDYNGKKLKEWKLQGGTESANLDLSSILPGTYFVRVLYDNELTSQKPIVKIR